jgi:hypothetical protein
MKHGMNATFDECTVIAFGKGIYFLSLDDRNITFEVGEECGTKDNCFENNMERANINLKKYLNNPYVQFEIKNIVNFSVVYFTYSEVLESKGSSQEDYQNYLEGIK